MLSLIHTQYPIYLLSHFMSDLSLRAQALEQWNLGSKPLALPVLFDSGTFISGFVPWALKAVCRIMTLGIAFYYTMGYIRTQRKQIM